jgi:type I restriction enzyme R subunit
LKKPGVPARAAFDENLTHCKAEIPQLFSFNALLIASKGTDSRVGSLTADWERFLEVRAGLVVNASSVRTSRVVCRWR